MRSTFLILALFAPQAGQADPVAELGRYDISNEARDVLVEGLKHSDVSTTAPAVLKIMRENVAYFEPGLGAKPWLFDGHSTRAKVWYAACAVWDGLFEGKPDPTKVKTLVKLLESESDDYSRMMVLHTLRVRQWDSDAEKPVADIAANAKTSYDIKVQAFRVMLLRCGDRYAPEAADFVRTASTENPVMPDKANTFLAVFNGGNVFFTYSKQNQAKIIETGFDLLEAASNPGVRHSLRSRLFFFVKNEGDMLRYEKAAQHKLPTN